MITVEQDRDLRRYAKALNPDNGEDAYHNAVEAVTRNTPHVAMHNPAAFWRTAIKRALYKIFRHEQAEDRNITAFILGLPPAADIGLKQGRQPHTHCRKGHPLVEGNLTYVGLRRTCKVCFSTRTARAARAQRQRLVSR